MRTLVVYESMYGNTHRIAESIGEGLAAAGTVDVVAAGAVTPEQVQHADLIVAGGPTHVHGMSRERSRTDARARASADDPTVTLDASASGIGIRDWLPTLPAVRGTPAAAFDTRIGGPALLTGRASGGIADGLRNRGFKLVLPAESFLVDRHGTLHEGELERARAWGAALAERLAVPA